MSAPDPRQTDVFGQGTIMETVSSCARCGDAHVGLVLRPLTKPVTLATGTATFWAPCPTNLEPVLLRIVDEADPTKDVTV